MNQETLRMQKLAGVITESQYKEKMNELENNTLTADKVEDIAKSSKFNSEMEKVWAKMSDQDKAQLKKGLQSAGILNEALSEGISFDAVLNKAEDVAASLEESIIKKINEYDLTDKEKEDIIKKFGPGEYSYEYFDTESTPKNNLTAKIGKVVGTIGKINAMSLGIPAAILAGLAGAGSLAMIGTTAVSLLAGAGLWWLGNKLSGGETGDFSEPESDMTTITP
jgi:hypothetical protein